MLGESGQSEIKVVEEREARPPKQNKAEILPVAVTKGKYKLGHVLVSKREEKHPEGYFYLDYPVGRTRKCLTVLAVLKPAGCEGLIRSTYAGETDQVTCIGKVMLRQRLNSRPAVNCGVDAHELPGPL